jgi:S-adenosylmethionine:tRNA ribosyltransferase-isomerase
MTILTTGIDFHLPAHLAAREPAEARGLTRDGVRLMVSDAASNRITHHTFRELAQVLKAGDVLVLNTSGTLNAALPARRANGEPGRLHLSNRRTASRWLVEVRRALTDKTGPADDVHPGERLALPGGAQAVIREPHRAYCGHEHVRLWWADLAWPEPVDAYLARHGEPIRYAYVSQPWPSGSYQTVYANEPGSAEMPSAGRPFTPELITTLVAKGVLIAPLILHAGVASQEAHEPPVEEYFRVLDSTARLINQSRAAGGRILAIGTTVVRALHSVADDHGRVRAGEGWTDLIVTADRSLPAIDGLLTGFHEPRATHLAMLTALAGEDHIRLTYQAALAAGYLWHEFGDVHLIWGGSTKDVSGYRHLPRARRPAG